MPPVDLIAALRAAPFVPFELRLTDGRRYEIRHPDMLMVGKRSVVIGLPSPFPDDPYLDHRITVDLIHVVSHEPLPAAPAGSNGGASTPA